MKNDVVRWKAHKITNKNNNDIVESSSSEFTKSVNPPALPPAPHPAGTCTASTTTIEQRGHLPTSIAINCDSKKSEKNVEIKNSFVLVQKNRHNPRICGRACASDLVSLTHIAPKLITAAEVAESVASDAPSRHSPSNLLRRTVSHLSLTKFVLICLQFSCVEFLCALHVGVAVSVASNLVSAELPPFELNYEASGSGSSSGSAGHYTHTWAVHIPKGDSGRADEVASDHGFVNLGKIFDDHYHFEHHKVSRRSLLPAAGHQTRLDEDDRVHWAQQQKAKSRSKRDFIRMRPSRTSSRALSLVDAVPFNDPKWSLMWYLNRGGGLDMNVIPAWKEGITGKGIVVTILDDGLESDHPDIEHNYDPKASYDVNSHDDDPMPHYDMTDSNRHGTRCAGEVAATANNSICAVGIAYGASVGGVRMLDGDVTDAVEARSLSLNPQHIDIYSASWGPDDDGKTVDGPGELASRAFIEGVTKGRNGKGSIFIWASGNGGRELDNCNCDGYTNSIWTLSISSATEEGNVPWYSEKCSSTLATTYSSGGQNEKQVVTTDLHHSCTVSHTGTSASAPLAAGIAALVLESNQNLTWRDLQHIVVRTAKPANLRDLTWSKNGVGRRISHSFGYGLMDAATMVRVARSWKTVPEQQRCEINAPHVDKAIPPKGYITLQLTVKHCLSVNYLEHVQAKITLTSQRRGDIQLYLKSPAGTKVTLLTSRIHDVSRSGFNQWPFMSVHTWGESPHGNWQLEIHNEGRYMAQITQWDLIFYGTEAPAQPDDPVLISPGQFGPYGNDMDHNHLDFDPNAASGQWRNLVQVGESSHMSSDRTSTACLKATIDQKCLACAFPTYIFDGRCYLECPPHTYLQYHPAAVDEITEDESVVANTEPREDLESMDRKRSLRSESGIKSNIFDSLNNQNACAVCDKSCLRCYGPLNSQCSTCSPGSQLRKALFSNETYCYVFAERSSGNSQDGATSGITNGAQNGVRADIAMFLLIIVPALVVISCLVFLSTALGKNLKQQWLCSGATGGANYTYDRVALLTTTDPETEVMDVVRESEHNGDELLAEAEHLPQNVIIDCVAEPRYSDESEEDLFDQDTC